jgi:hypothetical protein
MDSLERRKLILQESIAQNLAKIADSLDDLLKIHKRAQHCYIVHTDEQFNATIDIKKEDTNND